MPVLLFTKTTTLNAIKQTHQNTIVLDSDFKDHDRLRRLDAETVEHYPVVLTAEDWAMRGMDFRAVKLGICLIVDKGFETQRDADQGLARVGRFKDRCERLITYGTQMIDKERNLAVINRMRQFLVNQQKSNKPFTFPLNATTKRG